MSAAVVESQARPRTALVTGAGRNTGRAIALRLARDGFDVAVNVRKDRAAAEEVAAEIESLGRRSHVAVANLGDPEAVHRMVSELRSELSAPGVVVLSAATRSSATFLELSAREWRETLDVTLDGAFYCLKACVEDMIADGFGRIVAISGDGPHQGMRGHTHVGAAKLGLEGLIRGVAVELGGLGVTANIVSPGIVDTVRVRRSEEHARRLKEEIDRVLSNSPLGRAVSVDEIAEAVSFLCRPSSGAVNAQTLHVNGGAYCGY
ncbi:SDR family NAD(P)-dependent oxidoreductase [Actinomadura alba]|uniref:SDR family oxidoreductase n=1 Tax=Actinomadura alba TaxID=406431 RepID=A0ABR7LT97_9ACTN|nr:SDR family oxidoreductase [Actinomadura alba]MBC6468080.1 SDR family oxidoreductase [Actinomadura alba]